MDSGNAESLKHQILRTDAAGMPLEWIDYRDGKLDVTRRWAHLTDINRANCAAVATVGTIPAGRTASCIKGCILGYRLGDEYAGGGPITDVTGRQDVG